MRHCQNCGKEVKKGVFEHDCIFCNDECADEWWRATGADMWAYEESCGEFINYEDYMESRGATICDWDPPARMSDNA